MTHLATRMDSRLISTLSTLVAVLLLDATAVAAPKTVLVIRHADETGQPKDVGLSPRGRERASALPTLFHDRLPTPDAIVAARSSKHSQRPMQTIAPLAKSFGLRVDDRFADKEYAALAKELLTNPAYTGKTVVVCWHHGTIPQLASALGVVSPPAKWPGSRYDLVWSITFDATGAHLSQMPQRLLPGDSR